MTYVLTRNLPVQDLVVNSRVQRGLPELGRRCVYAHLVQGEIVYSLSHDKIALFVMFVGI